MRHERTSASLRSERGWAAALGIAAVVLVASVATAADATYRSAHGFTFPVPTGFVRVDLADLGLSATDGFEAAFARPSPTKGRDATTLYVTFEPVDDWGLRGMAGMEQELKQAAAPSTPGVTVERFVARGDEKVAPDRFELEFVSRAVGGTRALTLMVARAGRQGFAVLMLSGPAIEDARLRADFAVLRERLLFDPELVYRQEDVDGGTTGLVLRVVGVTGALVGVGVLFGVVQRKRRQEAEARAQARRSRTSRRSGDAENGDFEPAYDDPSPPRRPSGRPGAGGSRPLRRSRY